MVRRGLVGLGAALLVGVALGAVARLMMRLVAVAAGHHGEFSIGGTVGIMVAFVVVMVPGSLLAALWWGRGWWTLLAAGTGLLLVVATGVAISDVGDVSGLPPVRWAFLLLAAGGVYASILAMPIVISRVVRSRGAQRWRRRTARSVPESGPRVTDRSG